jgi:hypothetical protein
MNSLYIFNLFNDIASSSDDIGLYNWMTVYGEIETMCKEAVVA